MMVVTGEIRGNEIISLKQNDDDDRGRCIINIEIVVYHLSSELILLIPLVLNVSSAFC